MENFKLNRFWDVFRYDLNMQCGYLINAFAVVLFCGIVFIFIFNPSNAKGGMSDMMLHSASLMSVEAFTYFLYFGYCMMFHDMKNKQSCLSFLALPASNLEKFVSRLVMMTFVWIAVFFAAFICVDVVRMLIAFLLGGHVHLGISYFNEGLQYTINSMSHPSNSLFMNDFMKGFSEGMNASKGNNTNAIMSVFNDYILNLENVGCLIVQSLNMILTISVCVLFGALFSRLNVLFAVIVSIPLSLVFHYSPADMTIQIVYCAIDVLLIALCIVASYKLFCRRQVINNKLLNI